MKDKKNLLVITSYPNKGSIFGKGISGLASFAKNTVNSIREEFDVTVLSEINEEEPIYEENGVTVKRIWRKNSKLLSLKLLSEILKYKKDETTILLEFELATFGSNITTGLLAFFHLISKLLGYRVITVMHQVITDINSLSIHLGIEKGSLKSKIINFLLINLTRFLVTNSNKVIVLDEVHKQKLSTITNIKNVYVIPHGVETKILTIQPTPHEKINILYFGHITWYKGADWLVQSYLDYQKDYPELADKLFIKLAGGMSPTQKDNPKYIEYYNNLTQLALKSDNIEITGYVEENDFEKIFANTDIQILPYRALMSSSGPLSHAFEYEKPVLISNIIAPYLETNDIKEILLKLGISQSDIVFDLEDSAELFNKIIKLDMEKKNLLKKFSQTVRDRRSWDKIGKEYLRVINIGK